MVIIQESNNRPAWTQYRNPSYGHGNGLLAYRDKRTGKADNPVAYDFYCTDTKAKHAA